MNWMRYTALGIGVALGVLFLTFAVGEGIGGDFRGSPGPNDSVLLLLGPISLIAATAVARKYERPGGWWLIAGGIVTTILFTIDLIHRPMNLLRTFLIIPLPMLVAGVLWRPMQRNPPKRWSKTRLDHTRVSSLSLGL